MADAALSVGQHVRIVGLVGSAHLNGTPAIVLELDVPCAEGSAGDDGDRPDRLVKVKLLSGPRPDGASRARAERGDVVNCEPGNLVVVEPPNTLQNPWIPAGTALALGFWSPAAGVYAGLMFVSSGAVMLCFSIFCINGNPARGEGGLDGYFSFALPKFRGLNFTFQAGLAGVKWALPRWDPLLGLSACWAGFLLCAAGVELAGVEPAVYKRMCGRR